ncbi:MAG TPA: hypothetical protein VMR62_34400 [Bryobacteraceae bacterium]|jgi:hypothetical protein|nr:hypothetical protein [Bryobacteraceae bacterium]
MRIIGVTGDFTGVPPPGSSRGLTDRNFPRIEAPGRGTQANCGYGHKQRQAHHHASEEELRRTIRFAGFIPKQRDTLYRT